jgi:transposase
LVEVARSPDVAGALGVTEQSLPNWVKCDQLERRERDDGATLAERDGLRELRRKVKCLEQEHDLLKRAAAFFARETDTRCGRPPAGPRAPTSVLMT